MKTMTKTAVILVMTIIPALNALAQQDTVFVANRDTVVTHYILSSKDMETAKHVIFVNEDVTTHLIMPENIKLVDISTAKIVGNQCADNMVRIKPRGRMSENELAGTVTVIGERHLAQYEMVYTGMPTKARSSYVISQKELSQYNNPNVLMPERDMAAYAWAIYSSKRKFNNIRYSASGIRAVVNNIYTIGDYFFIDYSLYNDTKIKYDIDELRIKLTDKKEVKATNSQTIELTPVYMLNHVRSFKGAYRNVMVIEKLTFPDEKVLMLEISENQISGRVIYLSIEYADILHADGFSEKMLKHLTSYPNK